MENNTYSYYITIHVSLQTSGRSAVFYAAENGDLEMVKLLIQYGTNLRLKEKVSCLINS